MKETKLRDLEITKDNADDILELISCSSRKVIAIRGQMYQKAKELRDEECSLIIKFSNKHNIILTDEYYRSEAEEYKVIIREIKIRKILNES